MKKILVLDDDPDILDAIQSVLLLEGYDVTITRRGEEIAPLIDKHRPDLLMMDIMVAGMDGRDICRQLKANPSYAHIPIILFSASDLTISEVMTCGANDFLPKPFDINHMLRKIGQHLAA